MTEHPITTKEFDQFAKSPIGRKTVNFTYRDTPSQIEDSSFDYMQKVKNDILNSRTPTKKPLPFVAKDSKVLRKVTFEEKNLHEIHESFHA